MKKYKITWTVAKVYNQIVNAETEDEAIEIWQKEGIETEDSISFSEIQEINAEEVEEDE